MIQDTIFEQLEKQTKLKYKYFLFQITFFLVSVCYIRFATDSVYLQVIWLAFTLCVIEVLSEKLMLNEYAHNITTEAMKNGSYTFSDHEAYTNIIQQKMINFYFGTFIVKSFIVSLVFFSLVIGYIKTLYEYLFPIVTYYDLYIAASTVIVTAIIIVLLTQLVQLVINTFINTYTKRKWDLDINLFTYGCKVAYLSNKATRYYKKIMRDKNNEMSKL